MRTAFKGNVAQEVFNVVIDNCRFVLLFILSIGLGTVIIFKVPVS